jgi:urea transport system substrate-binding protein
MKKFGKKVFLVGSDYMFPRIANAVIKKQVAAAGGTVVGEEYTPMGHTEYSTVLSKIKSADPDFVFNTLNGDSNVAFFKQMKDAGFTAKTLPTCSVSVAEEEIKGIGAANMAGQYVSWNYYETTKNSVNQTFVANYKKRYGQSRVTDDPIEAAYNAVYLWGVGGHKRGRHDRCRPSAQSGRRHFN